MYVSPFYCLGIGKNHAFHISSQLIRLEKSVRLSEKKDSTDCAEPQGA